MTEPDQPAFRIRTKTKLERWAIPSGIGTAVALVGIALLIEQVSGGALGGAVDGAMAISMAVALGVTLLMYFTGWRRRRRKLVECDLRQCLHCMHDLRGHPEIGTCPECGNAYDIVAVRMAWRTEYPSLHVLAPDRETRQED